MKWDSWSKIIPSWDQVTEPVDPQDSGHWTVRDWDIPLYGIYWIMSMLRSWVRILKPFFVSICPAQLDGFVHTLIRILLFRWRFVYYWTNDRWTINTWLEVFSISDGLLLVIAAPNELRDRQRRAIDGGYRYLIWGRGICSSWITNHSSGAIDGSYLHSN